MIWLSFVGGVGRAMPGSVPGAGVMTPSTFFRPGSTSLRGVSFGLGREGGIFSGGTGLWLSSGTGVGEGMGADGGVCAVAPATPRNIDAPAA